MKISKDTWLMLALAVFTLHISVMVVRDWHRVDERLMQVRGGK